MIRFRSFENLRITAAISDISDGDCGTRSIDQAAAHQARRTVCARLGLNADHLVCAQQVHGARIAIADADDRGRGVIPLKPAFPETDGILTAVQGLPIAIFVADCVPVYLYDPKAGVGGVLHAGREGTRLNICAAALDLMAATFNSSPADVHAVIGPSAGPCCYEVSPEIAQDFAQAGLPTRGRHLDLWQANALQLATVGVPPQNIEISAVCTICTQKFHSYRRQATPNRNMALLAL